jgi:hypothetical protein
MHICLSLPDRDDTKIKSLELLAYLLDCKAIITMVSANPKDKEHPLGFSVIGTYKRDNVVVPG